MLLATRSEAFLSNVPFACDNTCRQSQFAVGEQAQQVEQEDIGSRNADKAVAAGKRSAEWVAAADSYHVGEEDMGSLHVEDPESRQHVFVGISV